MKENALADKNAIVTGAGNGIGQAIAEAFAAEGANVLLADIALSNAEKAAKDITSTGGRAVACACDVADRASAKAAVERAVNEFGKLNIVVCNAAVLSPKTVLHEMTEDDWDRAISVNLTGAFLICKYAIPYLRAAGGGNIILVASQMARVANPLQAAYCATKAALVHLAKGIALEYAGDNIRANALSPGGTATSRMSQQFGTMEDAQRVWGAAHPMKRLAEPREIARGAVFLASDDSSFMTGADLLMDGGYAAR